MSVITKYVAEETNPDVRVTILIKAIDLMTLSMFYWWSLLNVITSHEFDIIMVMLYCYDT